MPKHLTTADTTNFVTSAQLGANSGVATLNSSGKVPNSQLPTVLTGSVDSVNGMVGNVILTANHVAAVALADKGVANGVPQLDSTAHILASQLPETVVLNTVLGEPGGVATLDAGGKLTPGQVPTAPVTSVNTKTGVVVLTAANVGALATTQKGAVNGVASLDASTKVPIAQIPSLTTLYQPIPAATPTKAGMRLTAIGSGSNATQWTEPLVYSAASSGAMPTGVPSGSLCARTDQKALYQYVSSVWTPITPATSAWVDISLPAGIRGYNNNDPSFKPQVRKVGNQVFLRGRYETTGGTNLVFGQTITLPAGYASPSILDITGTTSTGTGGTATARFQLQLNGDLVYYSGASPNTPWVGFSGTWLTD